MGSAAASGSRALKPRLRARLAARRHTALLVAIVAVFAVRPLIGDHGAAPVVFSVVLLLLLLVAVYVVQVDELVSDREALRVQRRRRSAVAWTLLVLAFGERVAAAISPSPRLYLIASISWLLFIAYVAWIELRSVLHQKEVTGETISMAISVYLLFGLSCGILYSVIFQLHPEAFNLGASFTPISDLSRDQPRIFTTFVYFSLTTLSTIGFGDITPLSLQARYAAVAEGITGQFYLAILVARLVSLQMSRPAGQDAGKKP